MTVIYRTNKNDWYEASLAKKELAFFRKRNINGRFDEAIAKEEALIRQFAKAA